MLFKLYTEKDVRKLVARLKEEYEGALSKHREAEEGLKEENRTLRARVLELENERSGAFAAFQSAERERENAKKEVAAMAENDRKELVLLKNKCRLMLDGMRRKYPDSEDTAALSAFLDELNGSLGTDGSAADGTDGFDGEESGFRLEDVTSPKGPLDLKKLCLDLGLTEDDNEG